MRNCNPPHWKRQQRSPSSAEVPNIRPTAPDFQQETSMLQSTNLACCTSCIVKLAIE